MNETILQIKEMYKSFGEKKVHQGVNLELRKGEILSLWGGSGTGKSVVLRSIIGLENPDSGQILYRGQDITQLSEEELLDVRKHIAYVFQNGALFDSFTVEENLSYPLEEHTDMTPEQIKAKVNQMLDLVDMKNSNDLLPAELSGGMQKRAGLARAIILDPEIILFDEPTAGLDPVNTKRLLTNIIKLKTRGMTGIFVTHDIPAAFEISDRVAILVKGKIYCVLSIDEIKKSNDPVVQSFIQSPEG